MFKKFSCLFTLLFSLALSAEPVQVITSIAPPEVTPPAGSKVKFTGRITSGDNLPEGAKVLYEEIVDGITKNKGFAAVDEEISLEKQLNEPGHYLVRLQLVDAAGKPVQINGKKIMDGRGVMTSPEKIQPSAPRPADFDAFWDGRRAMLDAVPVKELERRDVSSAPNSLLVAYDVKVACAGSKPLSGVLTMPRNAPPRSLPAFVFFQGAGVSSAVSFGGYGKAAMTFMVNAHGIDNLRDKSYYRDLDRGALKQYAHFNKDDREKIYFHDMFLRVMRALDYVKSLPQWNGRILVVRGGSQGGAQAVVAAAMDPQVTMMIAEVPAMCDHNGFRAKPIRRCGWPGFYNLDFKNEAVIRTAAYYDMVNFASRIRCESFITTGLMDLVCPPDGVAALFNAMPAEKKTFLITPTGDHISTQLDKKFIKPHADRLLQHFKE